MQDEFIARQLPRGVPRRVYIRRGIELKRFGYTEGCLGCAAVEIEFKRAGHDEGCRKRIVTEMLKVDVGVRVKNAKLRRSNQ